MLCVIFYVLNAEPYEKLLGGSDRSVVIRNLEGPLFIMNDGQMDNTFGENEQDTALSGFAFRKNELTNTFNGIKQFYPGKLK